MERNTTPFPRLRAAAGCMALLCLSACIQYAPAPLSPARDSALWQAYSARLCHGKHSFTAQELERMGLLLNADLNKARLTYAKSTEVSKFAGLWEDPSLSADLERITGGPVSSRSLAPGFTIPVTGLPRLAAKVAEQYKEADYYHMLAAELDYRRALADKILEVQVAHARLELMRERQRVMRQEKEQADRLSRLGEVDQTDYHIICRRWGDSEQEVQQQETAHLKLHQELIALLGLHPSVGDLEISDRLPSAPPASPRVPTADELAAAPSVRAQLAAYGASETELRTEIRKQYPQIKLSPGFMREDKENKVTLGLELDIPLWNRNREAIARAHGDRALKAQEAISSWHKLLQDAEALRQRMALAQEHCRAEQERVSRLSEAMAQQEQLFAMGETTLPSLAEARQEAYLRRLNYLDNLQELVSAQNAVKFLK